MKPLSGLLVFFFALLLFSTCKKETPKPAATTSVSKGADTLEYPPATTLKISDKDTIGFKFKVGNTEFQFPCYLEALRYNDSLSRKKNQSVFLSSSYCAWNCLQQASWIYLYLKGIKEHFKQVRGGIVLDTTSFPFNFSPDKEGLEFSGMYENDNYYTSNIVFDSHVSEDRANGNNTLVINQMLPFMQGNRRCLKFFGTFKCDINNYHNNKPQNFNAAGIIIATIEEP